MESGLILTTRGLRGLHSQKMLTCDLHKQLKSQSGKSQAFWFVATEASIRRASIFSYLRLHLNFRRRADSSTIT
jgi:hypothetical protein